MCRIALSKLIITVVSIEGPNGAHGMHLPPGMVPPGLHPRGLATIPHGLPSGLLPPPPQPPMPPFVPGQRK